jgi:mannosylglycoprotein endo-beta-mannosidase
VRLILNLQNKIKKLATEKGIFLSIQLLNTEQEIISDNFYWIPDANGDYSGLQAIAKVKLDATAKKTSATTITLTLTNNKKNTVAFFNRVSLVNSETGDRVMPTFYSDNYVSLVPGTTKKIVLEYDDLKEIKPEIEITGWNSIIKHIKVE